MLPIKFEFTGRDGSTTTVYENFIFSEAAAFKIKQFLKCVQVPIGQRVDFEDPKFLAWLKKQTGSAKLGIENVTGKTKSYDRNKIESFIYSKATPAAGPPVAAPAAAPRPAAPAPATPGRYPCPPPAAPAAAAPAAAPAATAAAQAAAWAAGPSQRLPPPGLRG